ncbi:efflux RND transporter periplasmic adaptor subunit [Fischerella sp. NIES-3754]|uniref:efflux RND transporter periplasmic adaptor subunit n=1 Tax=Fischerella sp. NIES-3754 TaxID=1752063 RepID=UPI000720CF60|nr:efflux RND transporter periplasmic adaptor subunit [Fischerella sp. NIES-3754]BAU04920.1 RND family efflux transporter MFP subunit [Fischerella sp. NIES-3754]BCX07171.1 MAG: RND transporter [Fischerella sp.]
MICDGNKLRILSKDSPLLPNSSLLLLVSWLGMGLLMGGCGSLPKESAEAQQEHRGVSGQADGATPVDMAIARKDGLQQSLQLTGNTEPFRTVSLRSQIQGQLLALNVDVGDVVSQGQILGQVDDTLLRTALNQAEAELAALKSEVARANAQVSNARVEVERTRLEVAQVLADAERQDKLFKQGAIAQQAAQQARTNAQTAVQALRAAQEQVRTEQEAVAAAKGRLTAQQALVAEAKERLSYAKLTSPIAGAVLEKVTEPGNLLQPGNEVLKIGDFSRVKVRVEVSELELANIQVGKSVQVRLDAFPNNTYFGNVARISPAADSTVRLGLVPVEIVIPNNGAKIGSGLLARVNFTEQGQERVVVPLTAIQIEGGNNQNPNSKTESDQSKVFVVKREQGKTTVATRPVKLGKSNDGNVEIISGLQPGEEYVVRSGKPLKEGDAVRLSILSEKVDSAAVAK